MRFYIKLPITVELRKRGVVGCHSLSQVATQTVINEIYINTAASLEEVPAKKTCTAAAL